MNLWKLSLIIYAPAIHAMIHRWKCSFQEVHTQIFMKHFNYFGIEYSKMHKVELPHV